MNSKIAVLIDPKENHPPSDKQALAYLQDFANTHKTSLEFVTKKDISLLKYYSSLYIRTLTNKDNYTYQWAMLADLMGQKMIDTPCAIALGSDKHLQYELCQVAKIPIPNTQIIYHYENYEHINKKLKLKFPFVLKTPDGSFSNGVYKIHDLAELTQRLHELFLEKKYYSLIIQEYMYTDYDWRIGILNHKPLFVCKYYMAPNHWQIIQYDGEKMIEGDTETLKINKAAKQVLECALNVAKILDKGLYGIDIKLINNTAYLIEINDNPDICFGIEDSVETDKIYQALFNSLIK